MESRNLYEILVPTVHRLTNKPITTRYHKVWDKKVYEITGGMTIMPPSKGRWISNQGDLYEERVIPVRIACTRSQMDAIMAMTMVYYDQLAVMAYKISEEVLYIESPLAKNKMEEIKNDPKKALEFLQSAGIVGEDGQLTEYYR